MIRPTEVKPQAGYRLRLRFRDGAEGIVDLSDFAGRGVFEAWNDPEVFRAVRLSDSGALDWPGAFLCGDSMYMRLTGRAPDEMFANIRSTTVDA